MRNVIPRDVEAAVKAVEANWHRLGFWDRVKCRIAITVIRWAGNSR